MTLDGRSRQTRVQTGSWRNVDSLIRKQLRLFIQNRFRPKNPVLPVAVWQKVETDFFFKLLFIFREMPCNITQQLIKTKRHTE